MAAEYDFDAYLAEAKALPFKLRVSKDDVISIEPPNAETMLAIDEATTARRTMALLCGKEWRRVHELVKDRDGKIIERLASDMRDHFGLSGNSPGG